MGKIILTPFLIRLISTFFYLGYLPFIPGTYGSIAGLLLFCLIKGDTSLSIFFVLSSALTGFLVCGEAEKIFNKKDCRYIVIDEVCGMLLSFLFIPFDVKFLIIGFLLFRLLDTLKPFPAGRLQGLKGSIGVMSDDIVAGLYTNIMLQVVLRFISFKAS